MNRRIKVNETVMLVLASGAGVLFGAIFFGGLWWTVRKGIYSKRPALWFFGSLLLRSAIVLAGFYLISNGHWERFLACLLGFVFARFIVTLLLRPPLRTRAPASQAGPARLAGPPVEHTIGSARGGSHAP